MSNRVSPTNSSSEADFQQPPPTIAQVVQRNQAILRNVVALSSGAYPTAVASVIVQEETEQLLRKNAIDHRMITRDYKRTVDHLKETMAKQKEAIASLEEILAVFEAIQGN
ncbi:hypothetical protein GYMLUDRAFT_41719 [Collybiopsis luxurians FD-317 M1]|uniref:Uncharacterized protein n=1 Tax=Collybiopsis luxurians FD-317 M1 TaxID=944289 RepID=A0A0D0D179_9AGAR|nr:hypothetical protein GYMLUDRAFT_41719 [Collybiopsis luxurians FD-317 M1]